MRLYLKYAGLGLLLFGVQGCAFNSLFSSYPSQMVEVKQALNSPTPSLAVASLQSGLRGEDQLLYAQEAGRAEQIAGHFAASKGYYQIAIKDYRHFDDKAVISASDIAAQSSSLLLNDNVIPYRGPGYERIMLHQYQALNYLFLGDNQGALVEARRANELQQQEQQRYEASNKSIAKLANGTVDSQINQLDARSDGLASSFLNAYSYYVTGLLYELLGQANDAFIDYRKAAQIMPGNPYIEQNLVRLAQQLHMPQYQDFAKRFGAAKLPQPTQGQVIVLIEQGYVPAKQSFTVPFTINGNIQTGSLPTYLGPRPLIADARIQGLGQPLTAAPLANIDALASTALKEQMPAILARQAARIYAKSELNQATNRNNNNDVGAIAMQVFNVITEQADKRSWLTLPQEAQLAQTYLEAGQYPLQINRGQITPIEVKTGKTTLVWVIETGNYQRIYSIII
ncbi:COG3014 family protein [Shewanella sp. NIFS-20-20]|uniref:COG3014 family protein n=1 Tax=Shewanella sp. NIFS-20-20 TaxID=2853806 RepID=UPI001C489BAE|nr:hypothetical protein [Shewanella sp. NIFS-20-20]MBV7315833.1 hypothetical protein [Shewanella sp. NIFS-20-20]